MQHRDLVQFLAVCLFALRTTVVANQMCYICQYGSNLPAECVSDPKSWKGGNPRVDCPYDCTINAIFHAETGKPTYVYRGCHDATRENGCVVIGSTHNCFFSCKNRHYCNDRSMAQSPLLDSGGASTLTPFSGSQRFIYALSLCTVFLVSIDGIIRIRF